MDEILGHPTVDPHGSPIPDLEGKVQVHSYFTLSNASDGSQVRICALADSSTELMKYLNSKNIQLGTEMDILKIEKFDRSMLVSYDGNQSVVLSDAVCQSLLVEKV